MAIHAPANGSNTPFINCDSFVEPLGVVRPKGFVAVKVTQPLAS